MAITYLPVPKPGPYVNQFVTSSSSSAPIESDLRACIIGELRRINKDELAGVYEGDEVKIPFPNYEPGAKIYKDSVKISLKNIVMAIAESSSIFDVDHSGGAANASLLGSTLTDTSENFTATGGSPPHPAVNVGDSITVSYTINTVNYTIKATITAITETTLTLDKALPTIASGISYVIDRQSGQFVSFGNTLKTNTNNGFANVFPGDEIKIIHPVQGTNKAKVLKVIDSDEVKIDKSFNTASNVSYEITRKNSNRISIIGATAGLFPVQGDILQDLSGVGFNTVKVGDEVRIQIGQSIEPVTVVSIIDTYRIQISKSFASQNIIYSITRMQLSNSPIQLFDEINQYVLENTNGDKFLDSPYLTILPALQVSSLDGDITIKQADVYVDYQAMSVSLANTFIEIENDLVIEDRVGEIDHRNPLGLGVASAAANTVTKVFAIPIESDTNEGWLKALAVAENNKMYNLALMTQSPVIQGYGRAHVDGMSTPNKHGWRVLWMNLLHPYEETLVTQTLNGTLKYKDNSTSGDTSDDFLEFYDPLADFSDISAVNTYIAFWENGEVFDSNDNPVDPIYIKVTEKGEDNTILLCSKQQYIGEAGRGLYIPAEKISLNAIALGSGQASYDPVEKEFTIPTATFTTAFGSSGDFSVGKRVVVKSQVDENQEGVYVIMQEASSDNGNIYIIKKDSTLTNIDVNDLVNLPTSSAPTKVGTYKIVKILNLTEQAQALANIANSFKSRRVLYITNERCLIEVNNVVRELPGYYLCAAYAGVSSGTKPHESLTNFYINGFVGVRMGSDHFTTVDLQGIIVAGGGFLVVQDVVDKSNPYAWRQTTTDTSSQKTIQFSFTKNFDDVSYKIYEAHKLLGGISNNVPEARADAATNTQSVLNDLLKDVPRTSRNAILGPQCISAEFAGWVPDPILENTNYADIDLVFPLVWENFVFNLRA